MSRTLAAATALFVAAGSCSVAAQQSVTPGTRPAAKSVVPRVAGAKSNVLSVIQGNALDSANDPLPDTLVRLRDARFGRVIETQLTDKSGMFGSERWIPAPTSSSCSVGTGRCSPPARFSTSTPAMRFQRSSGRHRHGDFAVVERLIAPSAALLAMQAAATGIAAVVPTTPVSPVDSPCQPTPPPAPPRQPASTWPSSSAAGGGALRARAKIPRSAHSAYRYRRLCVRCSSCRVQR